MNVPMLMPLLLSRSARQRLLDEMQRHVLQSCTKDPAMPVALQNLITALVRVFWADIEVQLEMDASSGRHRQSEEEEEGESSSPSISSGSRNSLLGRLGRGTQQCADELAAAPDIARGILQVLVVEARDLMPVHGIGTNPYVRGRHGQQVRRSHTVWSNLRPAWNCLMEFPVISTTGTLELEVMSRAPLFGGDTRLGHVSLSLADITSPDSASAAGSAAALTAVPGSSQLAYRCEMLSGAQKGELVLILGYKELQRRRFSCGAFGQYLTRRAAQFRAFFLYHYWPCDKSVFQMYLHEPIDICILLLSLSPFVLVRAVFYTVLLLCLCMQWPPDEHQIVQFILAFKGTAIVTDGAGRLTYGVLAYYICARAGTCSSGGAPGSCVSSISVALDLYQEVLVWAVCFLLLPRSLPYLSRSSRASESSAASHKVAATSTEDVHRGGRMKSLLQYNLIVFAISLGIFLILSLRDAIAVSWTPGGIGSQEWRWRLGENFFWARAIFGLGMFPFLSLMHPQINKLLTHSTPTGFTRLGTLRRYNPRLVPRKRKLEQEGGQVLEQESHREAKDGNPTGSVCRPSGVEISSAMLDTPAATGLMNIAADPVASTEVEIKGTDDKNAASSHSVDPVEDLRAVIRRLPGGSLALRAGGLWLRATGKAVGAAVTVVSLEIRVASATVSLGLRAVDAGRSTALGVAHRVLPGSDAAVVRCVRTGAEVVEGTAVAVVNCCDRALQGPVNVGTRIVRYLPGGPTALSVLSTANKVGSSVVRTVFRLAAAAESPGTVTETVEQLAFAVADSDSELAELSEKAEMLKLEAAARLAELLSRAEQLAEREVAEAREALLRVQPEMSKISQALSQRSHGWAWELQRAKSACDSMGRSMVAWTWDLASRLPVAGQALLSAFNRELKDLRQQRSSRTSWSQTLEACSRVVISSACEAVLELQPRQSPPSPASPAAGVGSTSGNANEVYEAGGSSRSGRGSRGSSPAARASGRGASSRGLSSHSRSPSSSSHRGYAHAFDASGSEAGRGVSAGSDETLRYGRFASSSGEVRSEQGRLTMLSGAMRRLASPKLRRRCATPGGSERAPSPQDLEDDSGSKHEHFVEDITEDGRLLAQGEAFATQGAESASSDGFRPRAFSGSSAGPSAEGNAGPGPAAAG
eukprot:TRINITY_DN36721_c0_g1_i1.p1 TRINITY_DN36721_c0_g1~~TRINITY_DN36721_c0_g1_i1.p1  ORF type:complete len:1153 (+),score=182.49 TRINITY_DN36721_c0_g1_i1:70-3528(+)